MKKYWHVSGFDDSRIYYAESLEYNERMDGNVYGPFDTFTAAKEDALRYHRTTKHVAEQAIRDLKEIKKGDVNKA